MNKTLLVNKTSIGWLIYWWSIHDIWYLFKRHFFGRNKYSIYLSIYLSHILFLYSFISNPPKICQFVFVLCTYKHIVTFIQRVERDIESSFNSKLGNLQLYIVICCTVGFPFFPESFPKLLKEVNHHKILEINNGRIFPNRLKTKTTL